MNNVVQALPLAGLRVLVTRTGHQAGSLLNELSLLGATPVELPVIEIVPLPQDKLRELLARTYDWVILTSSNTVRVVGEILVSGIGAARIAVVGRATAAAAREAGLSVDLVPDSFVAEAVLDALLDEDIAGKKILIPVAETARDILPDGLRKAGALVDVVPVYRTQKPDRIDKEIVASIKAGGIDVVTFASPSSVRNLLDILDGALPANVVIACLGPVTARAVEVSGCRVDILAEEYSSAGLIRALVKHRWERG